MSRELASYARSGVWSLLAYAIQLVASLVLSIIVVRHFSTDLIGILNEARIFASITVLLSGLALERVLLRFVPALVQESGSQAAIRFFWKTLAVRSVGWVPWMVLAWFGAHRLDAVFHAEIARSVQVAVATGVLMGVHNHARAAATARFATATVAAGTALGSISTLTLTVVWLRMGWGVDGVLLAAGIGVFLGALPMIFAATRPEYSGPLEESRGESSDVSLRSPRFMRYALPFGGIAILNFLVHSQTEVMFLGHFHGPELAAFFGHGFTFAQRLIDFLPLALWEVSMAGFSRLATREPERLPAALTSYLRLLYLAMVPLAMLGVAFTWSATLLLYEPKMLPAVPVSQAYFVMAAVAAFGAPVGMILYSRDRVGDALKAYVVFAVVNVALDFLLIPPWGLWGGIVALGAAKFVSVGLMSRLAWREVPGLQVPWSSIVRSTVASLPVLLWLLVDQRFTAPWQMALGGVSAIVVLVVSFRVCGVVGAEEAALIRDSRLPFSEPVLRMLGHGVPRAGVAA